MQVRKSVALLESALPVTDNFYRAMSIVSLVEYSVGPDEVPLEEKVRSTQLPVFFRWKVSNQHVKMLNVAQVCYSMYLHSSRRSGISSCWTMTVEQPAVQPTTTAGRQRRICLVD